MSVGLCDVIYSQGRTLGGRAHRHRPPPLALLATWLVELVNTPSDGGAFTVRVMLTRRGAACFCRKRSLPAGICRRLEENIASPRLVNASASCLLCVPWYNQRAGLGQSLVDQGPAFHTQSGEP